jgi:3-oxoacyl-[acyl-carrier-protein] synthase-3
VNLLFRNRAITGLAAVMPATERKFVDEMANYNFPLARSLKLKEVMGYDAHRIVEDGVCASDLACFGLSRLFAAGNLDAGEIDALLVVSQSPDYLMPPTSSVIQGRLGLKPDMICLDINQGCAGFLIGLFQAFLLLDQASIAKVVLVNVDVLSRKVSKQDRNSYPLVGDAASITVVERSADPGPIHANIKMDGTRCEALMIPAGGFRRPSSLETAILQDDGEGNRRALDHLKMDGSAVFNFVQTEVPPLIEELLRTAGAAIGDVDFFLFHQPNRFMLHKLAEALGVPFEKMPSNVVEHYGNSSGVTIPVAIAHNLRARVLNGAINTCLAGFGVGLTWASMLLPLGPLDFCDLISFRPESC